jgi:hypothetical protein
MKLYYLRGSINRYYKVMVYPVTVKIMAMVKITGKAF